MLIEEKKKKRKKSYILVGNLKSVFAYAINTIPKYTNNKKIYCIWAVIFWQECKGAILLKKTFEDFSVATAALKQTPQFLISNVSLLYVKWKEAHLQVLINMNKVAVVQEVNRKVGSSIL